jgi:hypothetical protein
MVRNCGIGGCENPGTSPSPIPLILRLKFAFEEPDFAAESLWKRESHGRGSGDFVPVLSWIEDPVDCTEAFCGGDQKEEESSVGFTDPGKGCAAMGKVAVKHLEEARGLTELTAFAYMFCKELIEIGIKGFVIFGMLCQADGMREVLDPATPSPGGFKHLTLAKLSNWKETGFIEPGI